MYYEGLIKQQKATDAGASMLIWRSAPCEGGTTKVPEYPYKQQDNGVICLDVLLERNPDGSLGHAICRKPPTQYVTRKIWMENSWISWGPSGRMATVQCTSKRPWTHFHSGRSRSDRLLHPICRRPSNDLHLRVWGVYCIPYGRDGNAGRTSRAVDAQLCHLRSLRWWSRGVHELQGTGKSDRLHGHENQLH
jgi:hypothetical protein